LNANSNVSTVQIYLFERIFIICEHWEKKADYKLLNKQLLGRKKITGNTDPKLQLRGRVFLTDILEHTSSQQAGTPPRPEATR